MDGARLQLDYVSCDSLSSRSPRWWDSVLGVVGFDRPPLVVDTRVPVAASMTPMLGGAADLCEVWRVMGPDGGTPSLMTGSAAPIRYRYGGEWLFGCLASDEGRVVDADSSAGLRSATFAAYERIFALIQPSHPYLVRVWNYVSNINVPADGEERYRQFNAARQAAFRGSNVNITGGVPAASALGSPGGSPLSIYFLASCVPPTMIENPRQISAYFYPPKFGAQSPIFSRACLGQSGGINLFVSGTASIVGCETLHHGDAVAQTRECLANIAAVLDEANRLAGARRYSLGGLKLKVYVRRPSDLDAIEQVVSTSPAATAPRVYLRADVCREDLLVEIEAACGASDT